MPLVYAATLRAALPATDATFWVLARNAGSNLSGPSEFGRDHRENRTETSQSQFLTHRQEIAFSRSASSVT
jgi:hypothetical protein